MTTKTLVAALILGSATSVALANDAEPAPFALATQFTTNTMLIDFVEASLASNPQIKAAAFAVSASQSLESAAGKPLYNPEFELSTESAAEDTRTVGLSQTFDWGGKRSARAKVANAQTRSAIAEYEQIKQSVSIELLEGLADRQTEGERAALATERVRLMNQFLELTQKRFNAGDLSQVEANFAKLVYADARMQRATALADAAEAEQHLIALSNTDLNAVRPVLDTKLPDQPILQDVPDYLTALPQVQIAQHRVESAKATALLRKREKRVDPTISLVGGEEGDDSLVGLTFSIPIPIRNRFTNEARAANDQFLQEQQSLVDVQRRATARLKSAHARYQIAREAWLDWEQVGQSSLAQQSPQLRRLWQSGELSTTEFIVQTSQTIDSQDNALSLRRALWRSWFEWLSASGQIDQWLTLDSGIDPVL